jgi:hypothetical protein
MKVYEHRIDICLNPANRDAFWRDKDVKDTLMPVREHYFTPAAIGAAMGATSKAGASSTPLILILEFLCRRISRKESMLEYSQ